ncbi:DUF5801 repeats-in-toxin domain-containing protein [Phenylobacterium sp. Root700]|uniref:DUF5801 repeats-in-toxin domain-containing protein n=1 Tax=Phenylobacterium sp. Root700 TaxID=1736591 RepID=UPI0006F2BE92|nr:DUF5801 repeats-in-toxin domain-containing protein [Phenylobacterium sp. Root700]KRB46704.1 hypothetical protein ASE02_19745 [Phenylobacterium sp. Root700]
MPTNNETLISVTGQVTHDETNGLQTTGIASAFEDNNDQDVLNLSALNAAAPALYTRLFSAGGLNLTPPPTPPSSQNGEGQAVAQVITVTNGAGLNDLKFTDASGNPLNGLGSGLTTIDGQAISLYTDLNNNIVLGKYDSDANGSNDAVAFALVLEELKNASNVVTGGKIWVVQFTPLDHGANASADNVVDLTNKLYVTGAQELLFENFDDAPANQNAWTAVDNNPASTADIQLLITGLNLTPQNVSNDKYGDSVNTRATSLGSNNQAVNNGEALRFDTVIGITVPIGNTAADFTQSIQYGDHVEVTGLGVQIVQTSPPGPQTVQVSIFDVAADTAQGNAFVNGLETVAGGDPNNLRTNIASVEIRNAANQTVEWRAIDGTLLGGTDTNIAFAFATSADGADGPAAGTEKNQATVTNLTVGMQIIVRSAAGEVFDRMVVKNVGDGSFDLGGVRILDAFTDTDEVGSQVNFEDDGPTVALALNGTPSITVDETFLNVSAADAANSFSPTAAFGVDGDGGSAYSLLDPGGANSGLVDTLSGLPVKLGLDGADVVGFLDKDNSTGFNTGDDEVFRISIDSITGQLTLNQLRALQHSDTANPDDIASMTAGKVFANLQVTDGDGDTANSSVDISQIFKFKDDGPSTTISANATPLLQTDDTTLTTNDSDTDPYVASPNDDGGADGQPNSTVLAYSLAAVPAGTATGLFDTLDGGAIVLGKVGSDLVGYVNKAGGAEFGAGDLEVFRVSIDAGTGQVTLDQERAIKHDDGAEDNNDFQESNDATDGDPDTVLQQLTGPYIEVRATVTDGDGDSFTTPASLANLTINFLDDGPTAPTLTPAAGASVTHDETEGVQADTDVAGATLVGGVSIASLFSSVLPQTGDPDVSAKDNSAIGFARSGVPLVTASGGGFGSDGPAGAGSNYALTTNGGLSGAQTTDGTNIYVFAQGGLIVGRVGNDPAGAVAFAVAANGTTGEVYLAQYLSLKHSDINVHDESTLEPNDVFGLSAGAVNVTVTYTDGDNDKATSTPADISTLVRFQDDGPTITANTNAAAAVTHDETPGVQADTDVAGTAIAFGATQIQQLFDTEVPSQGDDLNVPGTGPIGFARSVSGLVTVTAGSAGADGPAAAQLSYKLHTTDSTDSGVDTTEGVNIFLFNGTGAAQDLILGRVGATAGAAATGVVAFALAANPANGEVFLTQYLSLAHPDPALPDEQIALATGTVSMSVTRTDGDGDTATDSNNDISLQVRFQDDAPSNFTPAAILVADAVQNQPGEGATKDLTSSGATTVQVDHTGADGFGSLTFSGTNGSQLQGTIGAGALQALTADGLPITLTGFGTGTLTGATTAGNVFTIGLNAGTDSYTFNMLGQIDNGAQSISLDFAGQKPTGYEWLTLDLPGNDPGDVDGPDAGTTIDPAERDGDFLFTGIIRTTVDGPITDDPGATTRIAVSSTGIGVASQSINPLDGVFIDFVEGAPRTLDGIAPIGDMTYASHVTYNNAGFSISQMKPNVNAVLDVRVSAYDEASVGPPPNNGEATEIINDPTKAITQITVRSAAGVEHDFTADGSFNFAGRTVSVDFSPSNAPGGAVNNYVEIDNLGDNFTVLISTANGFERMLVEDSGTGNEGFDISGITIEQFNSGDPVHFDFTALLKDGDLDTAIGLIGVTLTAPDGIF